MDDGDAVDELDVELNARNNDEWDDSSFACRMNKVSDASSKLGALLLQGWTMLAEECEKCCTPMMSLSGGEPRCVVCNPVASSQQSNLIILSAQNKATPTRKGNLRDIDESTELKQLNELNDNLWKHNEEDTNTFMQQRDDASNKLGDLLLKGWTMLAEHCQKCQTPLMSLRGGPSVCCICNPLQETQAIIKQPPLKKKKKTLPKKQQQNAAQSNQTEQRQQTAATASRASGSRYPNGMNGIEPEEEEEQRAEQKHDGQPVYPPHIVPLHGHYAPPPYAGHYYDYYGGGPPPRACFGFGARQDQQLRRTLGDIVKTVLEKMSAINQRMQQNQGNLQEEIRDLNALMEFLKNVQQFKSNMRY